MILLNTGRRWRAVCAAVFLILLVFAPMLALADSPPSSAADALNTVVALLVHYPWAVWPLLVLAGAPWLAAWLPQATPGTPWAAVRGLLDVLAANVGNAANAALSSPVIAPAVASGLPGAVWGIEHAVELYQAGHRIGMQQGSQQAASTAPVALPAPAQVATPAAPQPPAIGTQPVTGPAAAN